MLLNNTVLAICFRPQRVPDSLQMLSGSDLMLIMSLAISDADHGVAEMTSLSTLLDRDTLVVLTLVLLAAAAATVPGPRKHLAVVQALPGGLGCLALRLSPL